MSIQETSFIFKREGERLTMTEARLLDGTPYKSPKVESMMHSILAQAPDYEKISKCSELKVSIVQISTLPQPVVRIQSKDNGGLDITIKQLQSKDGHFLVGKGVNPLDEKQPNNKPETLESFAAKIFSWVKKPEMIRKFLQELKEKPFAKEEGIQTLLKSLLSRVDQLINSEDPIVEKALDHILAQKDALLACTNLSSLEAKTLQLIDDINLVLKHIEVAELDRQLEAQAGLVLHCEPAYLTANLTVKLKDADEFMKKIDSNLHETYYLPKISQDLQRHEENLAAQLKEIEEMEDLLATRTPAEQKAKFNGFIAQSAGKPFFQDMLNASKMMSEVLDITKEYENAYTITKPFIWAKLISYGPSIMSSFEEMQKKMPEKVLRTFLFLLFDTLFTEMKKTCAESLTEGFLGPHRASVTEEVELLRQKTSVARKAIQQCKNTEKESRLLIKIDQDRKNLQRLYQKSPEAKKEIHQLENTEYELSGETLRNYQMLYSATNPICQMMAEMGQKEYDEAKRKLLNLTNIHEQQSSFLKNRLTARSKS